MAKLLPGLLAWLLPAAAMAQEAPPPEQVAQVVVRVVLEEGESGPVLDASGELEVWQVFRVPRGIPPLNRTSHSSSRDALVAELQSGRCELTAPLGSEWRVHELTMLGRPVLVAPGCESFVVTADADVELRCRFPRPVVVDVVAAESGAPLAGVEVRDSVDRAITGGHSVVALDRVGPPAGDGGTASPIELRATVGLASWRTSYFEITAAGRARAIVTADFYEGGRQRIELARAGSVQVEVEGDATLLVAPPGPTGRPFVGGTNAVAALASVFQSVPTGTSIHFRRRWPDGEIGPRLSDLEEELAWYESLLDEEVAALLPGGRRPSEEEFFAAHALELDEETRGERIAAGPVTEVGSLVVDHLPPGRYGIAIERHEGGRAFLLTETEVEVVAGERARANLMLAPAERRLSAPVRGTIAASKAWNLRRFELRFEEAVPLPVAPFRVPGVEPYFETFSPSPSTKVEGVEGAGEWSGSFVTERLPEGRWRVIEATTGFMSKIDVRYGEPNRADLRLPEPAVVGFRLFDAATGEPWQELVELQHPVARFDDGTRTLARARCDLLTHRWWFRVLPGAIEVRAVGKRGDDGEQVELEIVDGAIRTAEAGLNEFDLRVRYATSVVLMLGDGAPDMASLPLLRELRRARLVPIDVPSGRDAAPTRASARPTWWPVFDLEMPGRYRVELPPLPGFAPSGLVVVDARAGETTLVELPLVRRE